MKSTDSNIIIETLVLLSFYMCHHHCSTYRVTENCTSQLSPLKKWDDFTPEIWEEENLKYLRDAATPYDEGEFVYDVDKQRYKYQIDFDEEFVFSADEPSEMHTIESQTPLPKATVEESSIFSPVRSSPEPG